MKKSTKAAILSTLFMGLGQFYNREIIKGIIFSVFELIILIFTIPYFKHSIWGLITLGDKPLHFVNGIAQGDHSIILLIQGIISLLVIMLFILIYFINIKDAKNTAEIIQKGEEKRTFREFLKYIWDKYFPMFMLTPTILAVIFVTLLPIIFTFCIAFTNYSSPYHLPPKNLVDWVGLKNFRNLVRLKIWSSTFFGVAKWTIIWATLATITTYFGGLFLALLTNAKGIKFKRVWRSIFILPYAIPGFLSLLVMRLMFSGPGPINNLLAKFDIARISWLTDPTLAKIVILLVNMWLGSPYFMVLMSGILTNIPKDLYEAADIDGATNRQKFYKITLPMIFYQTAPYLILSFAYNFNNFNNIYLLTDGGPVNSAYKYAGHTDILVSWIYKLTLNQNQYHMAAVISIIIFFIVASISSYSFIKTKSFKEEDML
ncbi:carbohydrate ABC transporter membrane protein 1, CUT1 family (TC 3.A.1.1.-) [Caminicella sporogenes DSM 14501]|uniref:Carbohydrate ABC transporter membrane protein 1, CUT1 family (TC 3.A.1.1.-) n=1 Tax=Caminicella sporogenes DSM 14501 TaxID=1121266 RepID=A0A1M6N2B8_9FIRM|nr:sugar ABC transporter permease [Caminicella sporogenes]RKD22391.1 sugar ABC transporter permease [Caminicella sporogenes]WIF95085.1 sugar ABC transporter permease [Caminicella sporogenes]SHJ89879.1 carbohydrate ABC transporter membrane protein 1, CUT1 family (TC 3.A.1.1.-) [Caminicella sporogenes DSM 14501]